MDYKIVRIKTYHVNNNKNLICSDVNKFAVKFGKDILYIANNLTIAKRVVEELRTYG